MYIDKQELYESLVKAESGKEYEILTELPDEKRLFLKIEERLTSTNTVLKDMSASCNDRDFLLIAKSQTEGKGRMGRSFQSPEGGGIYMSLLIHPDMSAEDSLFLTTVAAIAVSKTVNEVTGKNTGIKWVNDIFLDGKKICGILTEAKINSDANVLDYAIVGIGINVETPKKGFAEEVKNIAGAIYQYGKAPKEIKNRIIAGVVTCFYEYYCNIKHDRSFLKEYKECLCILGKEIKVIDNVLKPGNAESAIAIDIDEKCRLIVKYQDGTTKALSSGEISIRF